MVSTKTTINTCKFVCVGIFAMRSFFFFFFFNTINIYRQLIIPTIHRLERFLEDTLSDSFYVVAHFGLLMWESRLIVEKRPRDSLCRILSGWQKVNKRAPTTERTNERKTEIRTRIKVLFENSFKRKMNVMRLIKLTREHRVWIFSTEKLPNENNCGAFNRCTHFLHYVLFGE